MKITQTSLNKLKVLQPELVHGQNKLSGCFYLSANFVRGNRNNRDGKVTLYHWDVKTQPKSSCFIHDHFYICAKWECDNDGNFLRLVAHETSGKIQKWKQNIPPEYWHLYIDGSLCLATKNEINCLVKKYDCFASFFNMVVSQYFYQMAFLNKHKREPWEADRHGLFEILELLCSSDISLFSKEEINEIIYSDPIACERLFKRTSGKKIKGGNLCPFCAELDRPKKAQQCHLHRKQIKGYNKLLSRIQEINKN